MSCIVPDGAVTFVDGLLWTYDDGIDRWVSPSLGSPQIYVGDISVTNAAYTEVASQADYNPLFLQDYKTFVTTLGYIPQGKLTSWMGHTFTVNMTSELWEQDSGHADTCGNSSLGQLSTELEFIGTFSGSCYEYSDWADFTSLAAPTEDHATLRIFAKRSAGTGHLYGPVAQVRYTSVTKPV